MKTYKANLFISILLAGFTNCGLSQEACKLDDSNIKLTCQAFVKTICTKDTLSFYGLVDKEVLPQNLNQWIKSEKPLS
ncbi:MAG: hypothetical protein J7502_12775, partial [Flavisolibacter sp.]|nr:hypothetical protein [Flavisolibacter sp.]